MPDKERKEDRQPSSDYTQVDRAIEAFTNMLLDQATNHTGGWRMGGFRVDSDRVPGLYSALSQYPFRRITPQPGSEIPLLSDPRLPKQKPIIVPNLPEAISIGVEAFDHRPGRDWHEEVLKINLHYKAEDPNFKDRDNRTGVFLELVLGRHTLNKRVSMSRYVETGYEGHGFERVELSPEDLNKFLQLAIDNLGSLIPEQPFGDFLKKIIFICMDTNKRFRYDKEKGAHIDEDGMTMEEYQSPLVELDKQIQDLEEEEPVVREIASFRMEIEG